MSFPLLPNINMDLKQPSDKGCSSCYLYCCVFYHMKKRLATIEVIISINFLIVWLIGKVCEVPTVDYFGTFVMIILKRLHSLAILLSFLL